MILPVGAFSRAGRLAAVRALICGVWGLIPILDARILDFGLKRAAVKRSRQLCVNRARIVVDSQEAVSRKPVCKDNQIVRIGVTR